ncbi:MAG: alginate O-acetyltransferase complex protein AlgI, partial [Actinomycetota bacterium]
RTRRNLVLSVASIVFYVFGGLSFVFGLLGLIVMNFIAGIAMEHPRVVSRPSARQRVFAAAIVLDLFLLAVWKYAGFASEQIHTVAGWFGGSSTPIVSIALPIGISFFTFHHISYVVDVYRGDRDPQRNFLSFVTYIAMFPQLVAGPIIRYREIADQLDDVRPSRLGDFADGMPRFALGLSKKVLVADPLAPLANAAFSLHGSALNTPTAWIGVLAYTMQIYFDFSGYSDMAIGLARMFGYRFPENFNRPYSAVSITDFWRRWHMSLSRWFRDYMYIPLGGNQGSSAATYRNLYLVFIATGLWHGAQWTFLVWGLYHGTFLVLERLRRNGTSNQPSALVLRRLTTFLIVVVGWVFFRASSLADAGHFLYAMFVPRFGAIAPELSAAFTTYRKLDLALALTVVLIPGGFTMGRFLENSSDKRAVAARLAYTGVLAPYAAAVVAAGTFSPFLYFKF